MKNLNNQTILQQMDYLLNPAKELLRGIVDPQPLATWEQMPDVLVILLTFV